MTTFLIWAFGYTTGFALGVWARERWGCTTFVPAPRPRR